MSEPRDGVDVRALADLSTPWSIHVAATLRVADHIAAGAAGIEQLAAAAGADPDALGRLLRHLVSRGVFEEPAPGRFALNAAVLKNVLADWPDAHAAALLRRCAEAARPSGAVVVVGGVDPEEAASPELLMLVLVCGRSRTLAEFGALAAEAELRVTAHTRQESGRFIVRCDPG